VLIRCEAKEKRLLHKNVWISFSNLKRKKEKDQIWEIKFITQYIVIRKTERKKYERTEWPMDERQDSTDWWVYTHKKNAYYWLIDIDALIQVEYAFKQLIVLLMKYYEVFIPNAF
jgi:hypothetical protein